MIYAAARFRGHALTCGLVRSRLDSNRFDDQNKVRVKDTVMCVYVWPVWQAHPFSPTSKFRDHVLTHKHFKYARVFKSLYSLINIYSCFYLQSHLPCQKLCILLGLTHASPPPEQTTCQAWLKVWLFIFFYGDNFHFFLHWHYCSISVCVCVCTYIQY